MSGSETIAKTERFGTEFKILASAARSVLDSTEQERVRNYCRQSVDWDVLIRFAEYHRVRGLLSIMLNSISGLSIPGKTKDLLAGRAQIDRLRAEFMIIELHRIQRFIESAGIPFLPIKGPVLAMSIFGDIRFRPFVDLDILIRPDHFKEIKTLFQTNDYVPFERVGHLEGIRESIYLWQTRQYQFRRGSGVFNVDLHTGIMPPLYDFPIDFDELYARSNALRINNSIVRNCSPEDTILILCFHGVKNRWERLKYVSDLAELIRNTPSLDWTTLFNYADRMNGKRILLLGLLLAKLILNAPVPPYYLSEALTNHALNALAERITARLPFQIQMGTTPFRDRFYNNLLLQSTAKNKLRYGSVAFLRRFWGLFSVID